MQENAMSVNVAVVKALQENMDALKQNCLNLEAKNAELDEGKRDQRSKNVAMVTAHKKLIEALEKKFSAKEEILAETKAKLETKDVSQIYSY